MSIVDTGGRRARRRSMYEVAEEVLAELRWQRATMTEQAARASGRAVNGVLTVQTRVFDADGQVHVTFGAAAGGIRVSNLSTTAGHNVTVVGSAPSSGPPASGVGVMVVAPGTKDTMPMDSHEATLYGTAGESVCFWVTAKGVELAP